MGGAEVLGFIFGKSFVYLTFVKYNVRFLVYKNKPIIGNFYTCVSQIAQIKMLMKIESAPCHLERNVNEVESYYCSLSF